MFGSTVLEVVMGVIFVYLALSLVCTAANELIASLTTWRASNLAHGIRNLLNYKTTDELLKGIYNHPLIQSLYRDSKRLPSYIPSRTFALALMDIIVPAGSSDRDTLDGIREAVKKAATNKVIDKQVSDALLVLIDEAGNTAVSEVQKAETALSKVQENVETWFNDSMERVSGWYKRKTQALIFALALVFAVALNVDTIMITKRLSSDSALRAAVVAAAEKSAQQPVVVAPPANQASGAQTSGQGGAEARTGDAIQSVLNKQDALQSLGLPIGWGDRRNWPGGDDHKGWQLFWDWLAKVFGLLLTAGAASLGAPFWFDMLNKIVSIRSSGKAPEEKQKSPKEVPTPTEAGQTPREARESKDVLNALNEIREALAGLKKPE
ncbi:MAG TPA: hypothetical protein VK747_15770 [Blastocatellia bacterium]|nr:hypothetical protein [Blastocatellia bacterium]